MYSKVNEDYLTSIIDGLNVFMGSYKKILQEACQIEDKLYQGTLCRKDLDDFQAFCDAYTSSIQTHRIYLVPVLPFGSSNENAGLGDLMAILSYPNIFLLKENEITDEQKGNYSRRLREAVQNLKQKYNMMSKRGNNIIKQLNDGKLLFTAENIQTKE